MAILQILTATILLFAVLVWDILTDKKKYEKEKILNHKKEWWLRVALASPSVIIYAIPTQDWRYVILTSFMVGFIFWTLFDAAYNKYVLKTEWWTIKGSTSTLDKIQRFLGWRISILIKALFCLITILTYIKTLVK